MVEEGAAGGAFLIEERGLAEAGVTREARVRGRSDSLANR